MIVIGNTDSDNAIANDIKSVIEANGYQCIIAHNYQPQADNQYAACDLIRSCVVFIPIISKNYLYDCFAVNDIDLALSNSKVLIPIQVDDCKLTDEFAELLAETKIISAQGNIDICYVKLINMLRTIPKLKDASAQLIPCIKHDEHKPQTKLLHQEPSFGLSSTQAEQPIYTQRMRQSNTKTKTESAAAAHTYAAHAYLNEQCERRLKSAGQAICILSIILSFFAVVFSGMRDFEAIFSLSLSVIVASLVLLTQNSKWIIAMAIFVVCIGEQSGILIKLVNACVPIFLLMLWTNLDKKTIILHGACILLLSLAAILRNWLSGVQLTLFYCELLLKMLSGAYRKNVPPTALQQTVTGLMCVLLAVVMIICIGLAFG